MNKISVIESCYSLLRKTTPFDFDCGKLCNNKCCKGDSRQGMILFPGEENIIDKSINIIEADNNIKIAVCNGSCDRNKRPLACRIYPFFPIYKEENGKISIEVHFDLRGTDCPIKNYPLLVKKDFLKKVKRVGKYLLLNKETAIFYKNLSEELKDIEALEKLLLK